MYINFENLTVYNTFWKRQQQTRRTKTANIKKDDITWQHIARMSLQQKVNGTHKADDTHSPSNVVMCGSPCDLHVCDGTLSLIST